MKTIYKIQVCQVNRCFNLSPKITTKVFYSKSKADNYADKINDHPNKFVYARYENDIEVVL